MVVDLSIEHPVAIVVLNAAVCAEPCGAYTRRWLSPLSSRLTSLERRVQPRWPPRDDGQHRACVSRPHRTARAGSAILLRDADSGNPRSAAHAGRKFTSRRLQEYGAFQDRRPSQQLLEMQTPQKQSTSLPPEYVITSFEDRRTYRACAYLRYRNLWTASPPRAMSRTMWTRRGRSRADLDTIWTQVPTATTVIRGT
jgi:hypothetical protein